MRTRSEDSDCADLPTPDHGAGHHMHALQAGPFFVSETIHRSGLRLGVHSHRNACFHYVMSGAYAESTRSGPRIVPPRNALLKPPRLRHSNHFAQEAGSLRIEFPETVLASSAAILPEGLAVFSNRRIASLCSEILAELDRNDDCSSLAVEGLCLELLALGLRATCLRSSRDTTPPECVVRCEDILRKHYRDRLRFDALAEQLGVSRTYLATAFRSHHGCTMGELVRQLRVDYVKNRLGTTSLPIAEIALAAGFSNQSHCTRVFRAHTGLAPVQWRSRPST